MLNVHRARLLAGSRAPADGDESRLLCAVVAAVMSLMLLCGLLSVVPNPGAAFGVTKTYVIIGVGAILLLVMLTTWIVSPWMGALAAQQRRAAAPAPPAPVVRQALSQICACGLGDAEALGSLPTFPYEPPSPGAATSEDGGGEPPRGSCALCAVCLEDVRAGEMVRRLPACGHLFHVCCVDTWLRSHRTCPICRCKLPPRSVATKAPDVVTTQEHDALPPV